MKTISAVQAIRAASKRLPFRSEKAAQSYLEYAADSLAEAYRIGAEEAQGEIVRRLKILCLPAAAPPPAGGGKP